MAGLSSDSLGATPHELPGDTGADVHPVAAPIQPSRAPSAAELLRGAKQTLRYEAAVMTGELPPEPENVSTLAETVDPLHESIVSQRSDYVMSVVRAAMEGKFKGHRPLKDWEPEKLDHSHVQLALLTQAGRTAPEVAELLRMSEGRVRQLQAHPSVKGIISAITLDMARRAPDMARRLERTSGVMLDIIEEITVNPDTPKDLRSKNAFRWLDLAGYSGSMKHAVEHRITMDQRSVDLLSQALSEAPQVAEQQLPVQDADWQFITDGATENKRRLLAGGSGDPQAADTFVADAVASGIPAPDSTSLPVETPVQPLARAVPIQVPVVRKVTRSKEPPDTGDKDTPVGSAPRFMKAASNGR